MALSCLVSFKLGTELAQTSDAETQSDVHREGYCTDDTELRRSPLLSRRPNTCRIPAAIAGAGEPDSDLRRRAHCNWGGLVEPQSKSTGSRKTLLACELRSCCPSTRGSAGAQVQKTVESVGPACVHLIDGPTRPPGCLFASQAVSQPGRQTAIPPAISTCHLASQLAS